MRAQRWRERRDTYRPPREVIRTAEVVLHLDGTDVAARYVRRFFTRVPDLPDDVCWPWQGAPNHSGYGRLHVGGAGGRHLMAHRLSLALSSDEPPPADMEACHSCDNPICVNPSHLFWASHEENMADRDRKGRAASGDDHWTATKPELRLRGERHGASILTAENVVEIRERYAAGDESYTTLAQDYGVSRGAIRDVVKRRRWRHL